MNTWRERREYHNKAEEKHLADNRVLLLMLDNVG